MWRPAVPGAEADVQADAAGRRAWFAREDPEDRRIDVIRAPANRLTRPLLAPAQTQRREHRIIEARRRGKVGDRDRDMIDEGGHARSRLCRLLPTALRVFVLVFTGKWRW